MFNTDDTWGYEALYVLIVFAILVTTTIIDVGPYYQKFAFICNIVMFLTLVYSVCYDFIQFWFSEESIWHHFSVTKGRAAYIPIAVGIFLYNLEATSFILPVKESLPSE